MHDAARFGQTEAINALADASADVSARIDGWTPIHRAANQGHVEAVKALTSQGARGLAPTPDGWTPMHISAHRGHGDALKASSS
jgi:cytohesin